MDKKSLTRQFSPLYFIYLFTLKIDFYSTKTINLTNFYINSLEYKYF